MAVSKEQVIEFLSTMTIVDMANMVKELEEKWGVEAAPAVVAGGMAMPSAAAADAPVVEEQTEFDIIIKAVGAKKIEVIKAIREITNLGLKEAKDMAVDGAVVKSAASKADSAEIKKKLEEAGATIEVK
jgi:large subunit ribosomal protein L7/L12